MLGMSFLYEERFASQEGLCSLELLNFATGIWFFTASTLTLSDSVLLSEQKNVPVCQALLLQKAATNCRTSAL